MSILLLLVIHQSLSLGLGAIPDGCANALRSLTGNFFERAAITHVTAVNFTPARLFAEPELSPVPRSGEVAYTVQGPRNEVAIVVCGPTVESPPPAPTSAAGLAPSSTADGVTGS